MDGVNHLCKPYINVFPNLSCHIIRVGLILHFCWVISGNQIRSPPPWANIDIEKDNKWPYKGILSEIHQAQTKLGVDTNIITRWVSFNDPAWESPGWEGR